MPDLAQSHRLSAWAVFVWVLALLSYATAILNRNSFSALGPTTQDYFDVDATILGTFAVMQLLLYATMQIPVGMLVHRYGPTFVIFAGALIMALGQGLLAVADDVWEVFVARALVGLGDAGTFVSVLRIIAHWFPGRQFPLWTQLTSQFGQLGQIAAVLPFALLVSTMGWVNGFLAISAFTMLISLSVFIWVSDRPEAQTIAQHLFTGRRRSVGVERTRRAPFLPELASQLRAIGQMWKLPGVRLAFWVHFTPPFSTSVFLMLWGYPFLTGGVGLRRGEAVALISLIVILGMGFGVLMGPLIMRFNQHRERFVIAEVLLLALSWMLVLLWPGTPPLWTLIILLVVLALGYPTSMVSFDILRTSAPPEFAGVATGFINTAGFIATIAALLFVGVALDLQDAGTPATYNLAAFRVAMATQFLVGGVGFWQLMRNLRKVRSEATS